MFEPRPQHSHGSPNAAEPQIDKNPVYHGNTNELDSSIFFKRDDSTPESISPDESGPNTARLGVRNASNVNGNRGQYKNHEINVEARRDPASVYFSGHESNPPHIKPDGPLTTSLNATGQIEPDNSSEKEYAMIGVPEVSPKAQLPDISRQASKRVTSDNSKVPLATGNATSSGASDAMLDRGSTSSQESHYDEPNAKRAKNHHPEKDDTDETWNGRLLGPMEPMKIAKANRAWTPSVVKSHSFDMGDPELSPAELPNIPGFPIVDPGFSNSSTNAQSVPSISKDTKLASIINSQNYNSQQQAGSGQSLLGFGNGEVGNFHHDPHGQPTGALSPLVLMSPSGPVTQPSGPYNQPSQSLYYNDYPQMVNQQSLPHQQQPPISQHHQQTHMQAQQPQRSSDASESSCEYFGGHRSSDGFKPTNTGVDSNKPTTDQSSYNHSLVSFRPTNGGPLSFIPQYTDGFTHSTHHPMTTTAYPVLFNPMPVNSVHRVPQPQLVQMSPSDVHQGALQPHASMAHQAFPGLIPQSLEPNVPAVGPTGPDTKAKELSEHAAPRATPPAHTSERSFKCTHPGCDWSFARSSDQKRHIRSHQKPSLRCPFWELEPNCNRKGAMFYRLDVLKRHLRLVHLKRSTNGTTDGGVCRICSRQFETTRDFLNHCDSCAHDVLAQKEKVTSSVPS